MAAEPDAQAPRKPYAAEHLVRLFAASKKRRLAEVIAVTDSDTEGEQGGKQNGSPPLPPSPLVPAALADGNFVDRATFCESTAAAASREGEGPAPVQPPGAIGVTGGESPLARHAACESIFEATRVAAVVTREGDKTNELTPSAGLEAVDEVVITFIDEAPGMTRGDAGGKVADHADGVAVVLGGAADKALGSASSTAGGEYINDFLGVAADEAVGASVSAVCGDSANQVSAAAGSEGKSQSDCKRRKAVGVEASAAESLDFFERFAFDARPGPGPSALPSLLVPANARVARALASARLPATPLASGAPSRRPKEAEVCEDFEALSASERLKIRAKWWGFADKAASVEQARLQMVVAAILHAKATEATVQSCMQKLRSWAQVSVPAATTRRDDTVAAAQLRRASSASSALANDAAAEAQRGLLMGGRSGSGSRALAAGGLTAERLAAAEAKEVAQQLDGVHWHKVKATRLVAAARAVLALYGGRVPTETTQLLRLPGVGPKLAGVLAFVLPGDCAEASPAPDAEDSQSEAKADGDKEVDVDARDQGDASASVAEGVASGAGT